MKNGLLVTCIYVPIRFSGVGINVLCDIMNTSKYKRVQALETPKLVLTISKGYLRMATSKRTQLPLPLPDQSTEIDLGNGKTTLIDAIDYDLAMLTWHCSNGYAVRNFYCHGKYHTTRLHRLILERALNRKLGPKEVVDHINGIRTDNRRSNLRVATTQENCRNQCKPKHNTSGYKGVVFLRGKWQAQVKHNRKNVYVGLFNTALEAARAYDEKAKELFGEFAQLNFE